MALSRSFGATSFTKRPSIRIDPSVTTSKPAIIRRIVDFPHPEGPTSTRNSPSPIVKPTSPTARVPSGYTFPKPSNTISATTPPHDLLLLATQPTNPRYPASRSICDGARANARAPAALTGFEPVLPAFEAGGGGPTT